MGSGHGFLFTCKSRESLLVGQLLSQQRPESWIHTSSCRKEGRKEGRTRRKRQIALLLHHCHPLPSVGPRVRGPLGTDWLSGRAGPCFSLTWHTFLPPAVAAVGQPGS